MKLMKKKKFLNILKNLNDQNKNNVEELEKLKIIKNKYKNLLKVDKENMH